MQRTMEAQDPERMRGKKKKSPNLSQVLKSPSQESVDRNCGPVTMRSSRDLSVLKTSSYVFLVVTAQLDLTVTLFHQKNLERKENHAAHLFKCDGIQLRRESDPQRRAEPEGVFPSHSYFCFLMLNYAVRIGQKNKSQLLHKLMPIDAIYLCFVVPKLYSGLHNDRPLFRKIGWIFFVYTVM